MPRLSDDRDRIFLIDAMSFIFRAYHAMARQRGMSTRKRLPTAAIYVFVNMLRKLRDDPSLIKNDSWVKKHPELAEFFVQHPDIRDDMEENPGNYVAPPPRA